MQGYHPHHTHHPHQGYSDSLLPGPNKYSDSVLAAASYGYEQPASTSVYPAGLDLSKAAHRGGGGYMTDYVADYMADYKYAAVPPQQQGDYSTETRRLHGYSSSQTAGMETPVTATTTAAGYCHPDLTAACYRGDSSRQQQQQQQQQQHKSVITSAGVIRRSAAGSRGHGGGVKSPETAAGDTAASSQYHDTATAGERRSVGV